MSGKGVGCLLCFIWHTQMYTHTRMYTHTDKHTHRQTHTDTHKPTQTLTHIHTHTHNYTRTHNTRTASSTSTKNPAKKIEAGQVPTVVGININQAPTPTIQQPPSTEELSQWKSAITSKKNWSEAAPILQQYYSSYGFGITSRNSALR
jgi:hypothetical protein